jgi:hypothetical protein
VLATATITPPRLLPIAALCIVAPLDPIARLLPIAALCIVAPLDRQAPVDQQCRQPGQRQHQ